MTVHSYCSRIVGPLCLLRCLTEGCPVPNFPWPILNVAMKDAIVTCSSMKKDQKKEMQHKIQSMGGSYSDTLLAHCTHLVTDSVISEKYIVSFTLRILFFIEYKNY